jgi:hypothetical protein
VTVTVRAADGTFVPAEGGNGCRLRFDEPPEVPDGHAVDVTGTVRTVFYDPSGGPDTVFLSVAAAPEGAGPRGTGPEGMEPGGNAAATGRPEPGPTATPGAQPDDDDQLVEIAAELIGEREFRVTDDEESVFGEARRKAKDQHRDPAIDPRLSGTRDTHRRERSESPECASGESGDGTVDDEDGDGVADDRGLITSSRSAEDGSGRGVSPRVPD